jgi:hypothetical protein
VDLTRYLAGIAFLAGTLAVVLVGAHLAYARVFNKHVPPLGAPDAQSANISCPAALPKSYMVRWRDPKTHEQQALRWPPKSKPKR